MHLRSRKIRSQGASLRLAAALILFAIATGITQAQPPATAPPVTTQPAAGSTQSTPAPEATPPATPDTPPQPEGSLGNVERGTGGAFTLHESAYEVRLNATVLDSSNRTIQTLDKDSFHVFEDNSPQTISSFRHEDLPVSLGILIDSSGSMYDKRTAVDAASLDLVKLSNPQDEAFLVDFSWEAFIDQDFTNDISKLQQGLSYIKSSGGTAIYDALAVSADYLAKNAKHPKQVLLIITDGEDNASSATLEQAIRSIQDFDGPVVYCIGLLFGDDTNKTEARHARRVLEAIAEQTGGAAYFPKSVKDVDAITREVANDIRTQYTISYHPTKPAELGGYRVVRVEAKQKGYSKLSVRTRSGYFPRTSTRSATPSATATPTATPAQ
jgi:Ca-activated chloride channel family protein